MKLCLGCGHGFYTGADDFDLRVLPRLAWIECFCLRVVAATDNWFVKCTIHDHPCNIFGGKVS